MSSIALHSAQRHLELFSGEMAHLPGNGEVADRNDFGIASHAATWFN
jgi:hypothetical protein